MRKLLLIWLTCLLSQAGLAQTGWTVRTVPNTRLGSDYIHISDPDGWVDIALEEKINAVLDGIRSDADVFVVVLSSIGSQSIEDFATGLFNYWGIGDAQLDDGVLMLMVEDQHKLRFETGYGVESVLTDAICQRIFTQVIVPYFKQGDYNGGLYAGVCAVAGVFGQLPEDADVTRDQIASLKSNPTASSPSEPKESYPWYDYRGWGFFRWLLAIILALWNLTLLTVFFRQVGKIEKEVNPQHGDREEAAKLLYQSRNMFIGGLFIGLLLFCPLVLPFCPFLILYVNRKIKKYRNTPRVCERCGAEMRRLSEEEEDAYMNENQLFEENSVKVKDYDIWLCGSCGNKVAVPFLLKNSNKYCSCPACNCLAGQFQSDTTVVEPTLDAKGKGYHNYVCLKCGHEFKTEFEIPKVSPSGNGSDGGSSSDSSDSGSFGGGSSGGGGYTGSW